MKARAKSSLWLLLGLPLALFLILPLAALVGAARPETLGRLLSDPLSLRAIGVSLTTTIAAAVAVALFGTPLAYWFAQQKGRAGTVIEVLFELPIALPPAAAGIALLLAFGRQGWLHLNVAFTGIAVLMAQVFVSAPFYLRTAANAFRDQPKQMFFVAESDGADGWKRFSGIALPLAIRSLAGGLAIAWARAAGEFGATILFAGNLSGRTQTVPLAIYVGFESDFDLATGLAVLLLVFAGLGLVLGLILTRQTNIDE